MTRVESTVVCHVRAPLLLEPVDSKIRTLYRCVSEGTVDDLVTRSWPENVVLDSEGPHQEVIDRFERFERWADAHDVSIRPGFRVGTSASMVSEREKRVLVTPLLCLAVYSESQLLGIYPHSDGETTYTATDAIAALRSGELPPLPKTVAVPSADDVGEPVVDPEEVEVDASATNDSDEVEIGLDDRDLDVDAGGHADPTAGTDCPRCESSLVNVQGLLSCPDCRWSDPALSKLDSSSAKLVYLSLVDGPVPIEALESTLDLDKLTIYGLLQSLSEQGLVEQTDDGAYRVSRREREAAVVGTGD